MALSDCDPDRPGSASTLWCQTLCIGSLREAAQDNKGFLRQLERIDGLTQVG
jgi:hypothetical protein